MEPSRPAANMRKYFTGALVTLAVVGAYYAGAVSNKRTVPPSQPFDPALVNAKEKCQLAFAKWKEENDNLGFRAHFNQNLNACLVESLYNNAIGHSQTSQVIDIYDNKTLLEMDIELPGASVPVGTYVFENGGKVAGPGSEAANEYGKRLAVLFEEAPHEY
jgi:hypothetical protein